MAASIGGNTLHSWAEIKWMNHQGEVIQPTRLNEGEDVPQLTVKLLNIRWLFFDEVEAAGAEILTDVNNHTTSHVKISNRYKYAILSSGEPNYSEPRPFGGINTFLFGDFWQIPPTGQIAIMSNPFSQPALESAAATGALSMFWKARGPDALQPWHLPNEPRVLHLNINYRSKQDVWFSHILDQCRLGNLSLTHYNYLHGFPTEQCGSWVHDDLLLCNNETCRAFHRNITEEWNR